LLGTKFIDYKSLGTNEAPVALEEYHLPADARSIMGMTVYLNKAGATLNQPSIAKVKLDSDSIAFFAAEFLTNPVSALHVNTGKPFAAIPRYIPLNVPVGGGEKVSLTMTQMLANTDETFGAVALHISDVEPSATQIKGQVLAPKSLAAGQTELKLGEITVRGGSYLETIYGCAIPNLKATSPNNTRFRAVSPDILPPLPIEWGAYPSAAGAAATSVAAAESTVVENDILLALAEVSTVSVYAQNQVENGVPQSVIAGLTYT
jgi:hypothetical protein